MLPPGGVWCGVARLPGWLLRGVLLVCGPGRAVLRGRPGMASNPRMEISEADLRKRPGKDDLRSWAGAGLAICCVGPLAWQGGGRLGLPPPCLVPGLLKRLPPAGPGLGFLLPWLPCCAGLGAGLSLVGPFPPALGGSPLFLFCGGCPQLCPSFLLVPGPCFFPSRLFFGPCLFFFFSLNVNEGIAQVHK